MSTTPRHDAAAADPVALTTPIYETTTFVFEDAAAVRRYNEDSR